MLGKLKLKFAGNDARSKMSVKLVTLGKDNEKLDVLERSELANAEFAVVTELKL